MTLSTPNPGTIANRAGEKIGTRRTKRKVGELENASPGTARKRQPQRQQQKSTNRQVANTLKSLPSTRIQASANTGTETVTPVSSKASQKRKEHESSANSLSAAEQRQMEALMKKANIPVDTLSEVQAQIPRRESPTSKIPRSEVDRSKSRRTSARRSSRANKVNETSVVTAATVGREVEDENALQDDDECRAEYEEDELQGENEEDGEVDYEDDDEPIDTVNDQDVSRVRTLPNIGESDDEQEVSYTAGIQKEIENLDSGTAVDVDDCDNSAKAAAAVATSTLSQLRTCDKTVSDTINQANEGNSLATIRNVDESVVLHIAQVLKQSIASDMQTSIGELLKEIRGDRDQIAKLRDHVVELTSIITTTASSMFIKHTSSNPRLKEIHKKLCLLPALFNDDLILKILPRVLVGFVVNGIHDGSAYDDLQEKGIHFFTVLYFSLQPNEKKKEKFDSDTGRVYSKFRYGLLMSSFLAMQSNAFNTFRADSISDGVLDPIEKADEETSPVGPSLSAMMQPFWLRPRYVLTEHCVNAANKQEKRGASESTEEAIGTGDSSQTAGDTDSIEPLESSQSSGKQKISRNGPLAHSEIATEAASMVYKIITSTLYRSRAASKLQLFHDVMYIFVGWSQHDVPVQQGSLKIKWESPETMDVDYIDRLPRTKVIRQHDRNMSMGIEVEQADLDNIAHLETLISKHCELSLLIEHDVLVNSKCRRLHYRVNLIEVACRALASYATLESAAKGKDALCTDKRSLKAIVVLALGLRKLLDEPVKDINTVNQVPWMNNSYPKTKRGRPRKCAPRLTQYLFSNINGLTIDQLQPPPSKQKEILNQMILNLTTEEFHAKNHQSNHNRNRNDTVDIETGASSDFIIEADESQCVFGF